MSCPPIRPAYRRVSRAAVTLRHHERKAASDRRLELIAAPGTQHDVTFRVLRPDELDVFGLVARVLRDPGYSEETTQEVYLQVWRNASNYDPAKGSALAWLLTLAHRRAVDRVRIEQAAAQRESRYGSASADRPADVVADSAIFARNVAKLPSVSTR